MGHDGEAVAACRRISRSRRRAARSCIRRIHLARRW